MLYNKRAMRSDALIGLSSVALGAVTEAAVDGAAMVRSLVCKFGVSLLPQFHLPCAQWLVADCIPLRTCLPPMVNAVAQLYSIASQDIHSRERHAGVL